MPLGEFTLERPPSQPSRRCVQDALERIESEIERSSRGLSSFRFPALEKRKEKNHRAQPRPPSKHPLQTNTQRRLESSSAAATTSTSSPSSATGSQSSPLASFLARARSRGGLVSAPSPLAASSLLSSLSLSPSASAASSPEGFASRQRVLRLRAEAAWARWGRVAGLAAGGAAALLLWRGVRAASGANKDESGKGKEKSPSLSTELKAAGASLAAVAAAAALARRRLSATPQQVHAAALRRLSANPAVVEVLGAPLVSPPAAAPRAAVESGGGVRFRSLSAAMENSQQQGDKKKKKRFSFSLLPLVLLPRPAWRPRRVQTVFAVEGSQRRALASADAKRRWPDGELVFRVLALDIPVVADSVASASSSSLEPAAEDSAARRRRMFLEGDEAAFARGGVLPALRSVLVNAAAARGAFDADDDVEAAAEGARRAAALRAADAARLAEAEKRLRRAVVVEEEGEGAGKAGEQQEEEKRAEAKAAAATANQPSPPWWRKVFSGRPLIV